MSFNLEEITHDAARLRKEIVKALHTTGGGHYGGALSVLDLLITLYKGVANIYPEEPNHPMRDRIILSKGHACIAQYCILADLGFFDVSELAKYGSFNSFLEGHPDMNKTPGIDFSSGSLGQGLSVGIGMAMALKNKPVHTWVIMGDGECQEGQVWESVMLADRYKLNNLTAIVDNNNYQELGWAQNSEGIEKAPIPRISEKFASFGWNVMEIDGHDFNIIHKALNKAKEFKYGSTAIICNTVKGKGYELFENDPIRFHCGELTELEYVLLNN
ncbi:transketolase [Fulvivirga sp. 29W222]|uniref:Transketolase n=1 Tax=Fulvivirga marina TaxID=2494733 RepID=A0A937FWX9_9BACT|nr:transketolase [Fulvivirga marina]MBL6447569.1 transketolase [Fulvivirga marina]